MASGVTCYIGTWHYAMPSRDNCRPVPAQARGEHLDTLSALKAIGQRVGIERKTIQAIRQAERPRKHGTTTFPGAELCRNGVTLQMIEY